MRQRQFGAPRPRAAQVPVSAARQRPNGAVAAMREHLAFLRGFVAHPQQVGSVVPSSQLLEQRLVRSAQLQVARCVVELGPGTGGTTRALLREMPQGSRLLAIELNEDFATRLCETIADPRLIVAHGSAASIGELLGEHRLPAPEVIISGIPFSTMPPGVADQIAAEIARVLAPGGRFVAYQVRAAVASYATPYLGPPRRDWEWINIPPVRVFTWRRAD